MNVKLEHTTAIQMHHVLILMGILSVLATLAMTEMESIVQVSYH